VKILLRRGALGDVVLLGSVTARIGACTVVTDPRWMPLAARLRGVVGVSPWPVVPDGEVIDLQGSLASRRLAPRAARIDKRSVRRRLRMVFRGLGPRPPVPGLYGEACGVLPAPPPWLDLPAVPREALALIPGAAFAAKRWSPARFAAVGRAWPGPVVVLGGPGEDALVGEVAAGVPGAEICVEQGFDQTLAHLARTRIAVAGDTGGMHLAGAAGCAVVALFGPTHPADGFFVYPGEVVSRDLWCRPCTLHRRQTCPLGHHRCMDLGADAVIAAVRRCAG
jgi:heptosyltransferase-2